MGFVVPTSPVQDHPKPLTPNTRKSMVGVGITGANALCLVPRFVPRAPTKVGDTLHAVGLSRHYPRKTQMEQENSYEQDYRLHPEHLSSL